MVKLVMVIDDEPAIRRYLQAALESLGYAVACRADAREAVSELETLSPDIVLLDWRMPGLGGADAVRAFKAATVAPVVVCSAFADSTNKARIRESGCDDLFTKPIGVDQLETGLARWLGR